MGRSLAVAVALAIAWLGAAAAAAGEAGAVRFASGQSESSRPAANQSGGNRPDTTGARTGSAEAAWALLASVRDSLSRTPTAADFVQTYLPAGFSSGERETGTVYLAFPDRLRWDYDIPYPKSYLVNGELAFAWNHGDASGRRHRLTPEDEGHLDLLRLRIEELRPRYSARLEESAGAPAAVTLEPLSGEGRIRQATLLVDQATLRLVGLSYSDVEDNVTRFELSGHRPLPLDATGSARFLPPDDVAFVED